MYFFRISTDENVKNMYKKGKFPDSQVFLKFEFLENEFDCTLRKDLMFDLLTLSISQVSNAQDGGADSESSCLGSDCSDKYSQSSEQRTQ